MHGSLVENLADLIIPQGYGGVKNSAVKISTITEGNDDWRDQ